MEHSVVGCIDFLPAINVPSEFNGRNNQLFGVQHGDFLEVGRKVKFKFLSGHRQNYKQFSFFHCSSANFWH